MQCTCIEYPKLTLSLSLYIYTYRKADRVLLASVVFDHFLSLSRLRAAARLLQHGSLGEDRSYQQTWLHCPPFRSRCDGRKNIAFSEIRQYNDSGAFWDVSPFFFIRMFINFPKLKHWVSSSMDKTRQVNQRLIVQGKLDREDPATWPIEVKRLERFGVGYDSEWPTYNMTIMETVRSDSLPKLTLGLRFLNKMTQMGFWFQKYDELQESVDSDGKASRKVEVGFLWFSFLGWKKWWSKWFGPTKMTSSKPWDAKVRQSAKCPTTVYVKNLAFNVDETTLEQHFQLLVANYNDSFRPQVPMLGHGRRTERHDWIFMNHDFHQLKTTAR